MNPAPWFFLASVISYQLSAISEELELAARNWKLEAFW
jgi:hypothetical protein